MERNSRSLRSREFYIVMAHCQSGENLGVLWRTSRHAQVYQAYSRGRKAEFEASDGVESSMNDHKFKLLLYGQRKKISTRAQYDS